MVDDVHHVYSTETRTVASHRRRSATTMDDGENFPRFYEIIEKKIEFEENQKTSIKLYLRV
jgi:hypothetical protein